MLRLRDRLSASGNLHRDGQIFRREGVAALTD
jgi:hypothetical protein